MGTRRFPKEEDLQPCAGGDGLVWPERIADHAPNNVDNGRTEEDIAPSNGAKLLGPPCAMCWLPGTPVLDNVSQGDAPFLIMHGTADKGVPLVQARSYQAAGARSGVHAVGVEGRRQLAGVYTPEAKKIPRFFYETLETLIAFIHSNTILKTISLFVSFFLLSFMAEAAGFRVFAPSSRSGTLWIVRAIPGEKVAVTGGTQGGSRGWQGA